MGVSFQQSETCKNLMRAFAGESQARNRYTMAAEQAKQQQLEVISQIFLYTADQERAHAKVFYDLLGEMAGETIDIEGSFPVDISEDIPSLLRSAQHNEHEEESFDYPAFAAAADKEGYKAISRIFEMIAQVEGDHAKRFGQLADMMEQNKLFVSNVETGWICLNCGTKVTSAMAPAQCPVCKHDRGWFVRVEYSPWVCGEGCDVKQGN